MQLTQSMTQNTGFHLSNILKLMSLNLGISVIIPSYNAETTIEECLKTIFSETKNFDAEIISIFLSTMTAHEEHPISVTGDKNNSLFVEIADKGIGIKKGNFNKIFDKFFREPQGNVHNVKGFGLGLSYVKNMLEKHDASIQVTSNKNKGSVFLIKFKIDNGK